MFAGHVLSMNALRGLPPLLLRRSSPTNRLPALGALLSRPGKPGVYPFPDDRAREISKYTICRGIFNRDTPGGCLRSYRASWITGIDKRTFALKIDRAPTINIIFL